METKFKKGDRVRVISLRLQEEDAGIKIGDIGTILDTNTEPYVKMDKKNNYFHDCNGLCSDDRGWNFNQGQLELIEEKPQFKRGDRVLVTTTNGAKWEERIFLTIIEGSAKPYVCVEKQFEEEFLDGERCFYTQGWDKIKPLENEVKCWEDLDNIEGYWMSDTVEVVHSPSIGTLPNNRNIFATREQAEASIVLAQLSQLMKNVNGDWTPDWGNNEEDKYSITFSNNKINRYFSIFYSKFLSFPTEEIRDKFLENHRELIMKAKPLL